VRYFKRKWDETRGDQYDSWGTSIYYFEVGSDGYPIRQIEIYENGNSLFYGPDKLFDDYGGLGDQALDLDEFSAYEINADEFNNILYDIKPIN
jgi:hypothetical protein